MQDFTLQKCKANLITFFHNNDDKIVLYVLLNCHVFIKKACVRNTRKLLFI